MVRQLSCFGHTSNQVEVTRSVEDGGCHTEEYTLGCCITRVECECDRDDGCRAIFTLDTSHVRVTRGNEILHPDIVARVRGTRC